MQQGCQQQPGLLLLLGLHLLLLPLSLPMHCLLHWLAVQTSPQWPRSQPSHRCLKRPLLVAAVAAGAALWMLPQVQVQHCWLAAKQQGMLGYHQTRPSRLLLPLVLQQVSLTVRALAAAAAAAGPEQAAAVAEMVQTLLHLARLLQQVV
jgi:hypothetical protein